MRVCFRTPAANTHDAMVLDLASSVLSNGKAGLFDLNLNKQQKAQGTQAGLQQYKDYGLFIMLRAPKQGQKLEEVKDLLMGQLELLKKGDFDESMIKAICSQLQVRPAAIARQQHQQRPAFNGCFYKEPLHTMG